MVSGFVMEGGGTRIEEIGWAERVAIPARERLGISTWVECRCANEILREINLKELK